MMNEKSIAIMIDEAGEYRYAHRLCTVNHHKETKKRLAEVMCGTCGLVFKDNHMLVSGETPVCRDGREYVRAPDLPDLVTDLTDSPQLRSA